MNVSAQSTTALNRGDTIASVSSTAVSQVSATRLYAQGSWQVFIPSFQLIFPTSPSQSSETGSRASTSREQSLVDILKAGSQGGVQDFLPLTIDTRGAYQDDEWDEDLPPAKRSREDEDDENEEGDQTFKVFDPGRARKSMTPTENITSYVSQNFQRCLNKATRRKLAREHPQPSIPAVTPQLAVSFPREQMTLSGQYRQQS